MKIRELFGLLRGPWLIIARIVKAMMNAEDKIDDAPGAGMIKRVIVSKLIEALLRKHGVTPAALDLIKPLVLEFLVIAKRLYHAIGIATKR